MGIFTMGKGSGGLLGHGAARNYAALDAAAKGPGWATAAAEQVDIEARAGVTDWTRNPDGGVDPVTDGGE